MKVGDLVKAPYLVDHTGGAGIVINIRLNHGSMYDVVEVLFSNGARRVFRHLLEVINESR